jgi:hypothetical protein
MAIIWPHRLPNWVVSDPRREAEKRVYEKLSKLLNDDWHVYYSRPWMGLSLTGSEIDGEADFILAHPDKGILFIEVKGGRISYSPEKSQWQTKDRNGILHNIKDPILQARGCKHEMLNKLKKIQSWPQSYVRLRHGVVFPDSDLLNENILSLGGYEKEYFCFMREFESSFEHWIEHRLRNHSAGGFSKDIPPGQEGIRCLNQIIADPITLKVPLRRMIDGELERMELLLTGAQYALVPYILTCEKILIEGGAGTGKTILALEAAVREAANNIKVLFTCRSLPLSRSIKFSLSDIENIDVIPLENVLAFDSKLSVTDEISQFNWDVIYIDEAQDVTWETWELLDRLVCKNNTKLRIFMDSNQAVYRPKEDVATRLGLSVFPLRLNLRNTKKIAKITEQLYQGPLIDCNGPDGEVPYLWHGEFKAALNDTVTRVVNLIRSEHINPNMLAILVPTAEVRESVISLLTKMHVPAVDALRSNNSEVVVESVARYKGLEREIVFLIADKALAKNKELSYVAVSRARSRLFVYGDIKDSSLEKALLAN